MTESVMPTKEKEEETPEDNTIADTFTFDADLEDGKPREVTEPNRFNPWFDFKFIKGKKYALRSVPMQKTKKNGNGTSETIRFWSTTYVGEDGQQHEMHNSSIDGEKLDAKFSVNQIPPTVLHRNRIRAHHQFTIREVFAKVRNVIRANLTLTNSNDYDTVAVWVIAAHFVPVFKAFPPLIFSKSGYGAGGSTALTVMSLAPYPAIIFDPTEAVLFRMAEFGGALLTDEVKDDDKTNIKVLNVILDGSFNKGALIPRASGKNHAVEIFDPYCPKTLVDPYTSIIWPATLSRSVRVTVRYDKNRSNILSVSEFIAENRDLIDQLYGLFLLNAHIVRRAYDQVSDLTGRQKQAYSPLIAIADMVGVKQAVIASLQESIDNVTMTKNENDPVKFLLLTLYDYMNTLTFSSALGVTVDGWRETNDKAEMTIEFTTLRKKLSDIVKETHQVDESQHTVTSKDKETGMLTSTTYKTKREWKKIPTDIRDQFEKPGKFNSTIGTALNEWRSKVRGDRWGLRVRINPNDQKKIMKRLEEILQIEPDPDAEKTQSEKQQKDQEIADAMKTDRQN